MFQIVFSELDHNGKVTARRAVEPPFELREDALAIAEFDASRMSENHYVAHSDDSLSVIDNWGRRFRIEIKEVALPAIEP
jgi:hypothetical protein